jgi:hypothetical protein
MLLTALRSASICNLMYSSLPSSGSFFASQACRRLFSARSKAFSLRSFIRRFLLHVLPKGFHRIRHYGLFASANRAESLATARALLGVVPPAAAAQKQPDVAPDSPRVLPSPCPCCGARMIVIEAFARGCKPRWRPTPVRIDTS